MSQVQLLSLVSNIIIMILSLSVHECAHAAMASWLGDDTAKRMGRLTLDPRSHVDPIGTILMPAIGAWGGIPLLAWANPVPTNPLLYSRKMFGKRVTMGFGHMLVAIAGPLSNILFAAVLVLVLGGAMRFADVDRAAYLMVQSTIVMNIGLFVFNLLPVPPLDGSRVVTFLLPRHLRERYNAVRGMLSFIVLILAVQSGVIRMITRPLTSLAQSLLMLVSGY